MFVDSVLALSPGNNLSGKKKKKKNHQSACDTRDQTQISCFMSYSLLLNLTLGCPTSIWSSFTHFYLPSLFLSFWIFFFLNPGNESRVWYMLIPMRYPFGPSFSVFWETKREKLWDTITSLPWSFLGAIPVDPTWCTGLNLGLHMARHWAIPWILEFSNPEKIPIFQLISLLLSSELVNFVTTFYQTSSKC